MTPRKRILVAPLNWGLGHATRCIPIIKALITTGREPVLASDGIALELLKKEFPDLTTIELPTYGITYSKKGKWFKMKLVSQTPKLISTIKQEKALVKDIVTKYDIKGIISDNRLGVHHKKVPSVFITHQLQVLSGSTTWLSTKFHEKYIARYNQCWVPDHQFEPNLSGDLGHSGFNKIPLQYLGPISRFTHKSTQKKYDILLLLSGPEPQRSLLEAKFLETFKDTSKKVLFVKGKIEDEQTVKTTGNLTLYNFMTSPQLEAAINASNLVVSRSGYTTVMDLTKLEKKAFFIPTPGQFEQEYLAKRLEAQQLVPTCTQDEFNLEQLQKVKDYKGLSGLNSEVNYNKLFDLF